MQTRFSVHTPMPIASATLADIPKPISQLAKRRPIVAPEKGSRELTDEGDSDLDR
jgi:hypothetical protein